MLVFNLKKEWYDKIVSGEKFVEYRDTSKFWVKRVENAVRKITDKNFLLYLNENEKRDEQGTDVVTLNIPCRFVKGYTKCSKSGTVQRIRVVHKGNTDLKDNKNDFVFAFYFTLDK